MRKIPIGSLLLPTQLYAPFYVAGGRTCSEDKGTPMSCFVPALDSVPEGSRFHCKLLAPAFIGARPLKEMPWRTALGYIRPCLPYIDARPLPGQS
jgi:hypothetical protein